VIGCSWGGGVMKIINSVGFRKLFGVGGTSLFLGLTLLMGCQRDSNPLLATSSSPVSNATLTPLSFDTNHFPFIRLSFLAETEDGPITNLRLSNIAIRVGDDPEIPLSLNTSQATSGIYTVEFRSRKSPELTTTFLRVVYN